MRGAKSLIFQHEVGCGERRGRLLRGVMVLIGPINYCTDSPQVRLVRECILGLAKNDLATAAKLLHKDYRRIIYPRSLGKPVVAREEWLKQCGQMIGHWTDSEVSCGSFCSNTLPWLL